MRKLALSFQRDPLPGTGGVAISSQNTATQITNAFNDNTANNVVSITIAADNAVGTANKTDVYLLAGRGVAARKTLGAGITISGDFTTIAEFLDMMNTVPSYIAEITLQTDNTANFSERIEWADGTLNKLNETVKRIELSQYRQSTGNGYSDTLNIKDRPFVALPQTWLKFVLLKNSSIKITLKIPQAQVSAALAPVAF